MDNKVYKYGNTRSANLIAITGRNLTYNNKTTQELTEDDILPVIKSSENILNITSDDTIKKMETKELLINKSELIDTTIKNTTITTANITSLTANTCTLKTSGESILLKFNNTLSSHPWEIYQATSTGNLCFNYDDNDCAAFLGTSVFAGEIDFTGQHRSISDKLIELDYLEGLIVCSTGIYSNISKSIIEINEALPKVELSSKENQKSCFGVISSKEDKNISERYYSQGSFISVLKKQDTRLIINSLGEGGIWICNINGNLENGDYITTSNIPGFGMLQTKNQDILCNFTVAKITCDCDFSLGNQYILKYIKILEDKYEVYTDNELTDLDFSYDFDFTNSSYSSLVGETYKSAFVGCTYHCG
jgi:hypothetical protein